MKKERIIEILPYFMAFLMLMVLVIADLLISGNPVLLISKIPISLFILVGLYFILSKKEVKS